MQKKGILKNRMTEEQKERQRKADQQNRNNEADAPPKRKRKSLDNFYLQTKKNMEPITQQDQGRSQEHDNLQVVKEPHSQTLDLGIKKQNDAAKEVRTEVKEEKKKKQRKNEPLKQKQKDNDQDEQGRYIHVDNQYNKDIKIIGQEFRIAINQTLKQIYSAPELRQQRALFEDEALSYMNAYLIKLKSLIKYNIVPAQKKIQKVIIPPDQNLMKQNEIYLNLLKTGKQRNKKIKIKHKKQNINPEADKQIMIIKENTGQLVSVGEMVQKLQKEQYKYQEEISLMRQMENNCIQMIIKQKQKQIAAEVNLIKKN